MNFSDKFPNLPRVFIQPIMKYVRKPDVFWDLSPEEKERWIASTSEGRKAIEIEYRIREVDNIGMHPRTDAG